MNIRNIIPVLLISFMAALGVAYSCSSSSANDDKSKVMNDGVYEGIGEGRNGMIKVSVTVKDHVITDVRVVQQSESSFAQETISNLIMKIMQAQTTEGIDAISGATLTSNGVIAAMTMAINAALGVQPTLPDYKDTECDVVVVGAGGAGLAAAIEATASGARVIVLEKRSFIGGNTNSSTGGINAAETRFQEALGIKDSRTAFYNDIMTGGHQLNDVVLAHTLADKSAETLHWIAGFGADLTDVGSMAGSSIPRTHRPKGGLAIGPHLMKVLYDKAKEMAIDIRTSNTVTDVKRAADGSVAGVDVQCSNGKSYSIRSKAVILATGGFGANMKMVAQYRKDLEGFSSVNHPGATGDAFAWVSKFGAELYQMDQIQTHPTVEIHKTVMITEAVRGNGAILVNRSGKRFVNEMDMRDAVSAAILKQTGESAFLVFDDGVRKSLASIETYFNQGLVTEAATLTELASTMGISADAFSNTISAYNEYQKKGEDKDFSRTPMPLPLSKAPFYAIEVKPAIHHTMGGVHINADANVLDTEGNAIKGLYAAGEVTGGVHGGNRLGGNGVADIVVFGKIAGASAAKFVK
ncbi:MAG: flavocytochrome c [Bacteroidaceae bacterium]|nr:flavocytochrome c [Bacteroidaceae bacterium]